MYAFTADLIAGVKSFNQRLITNGVKYQFPEDPTPHWLPRKDGRHLYQEYFLAVDGDANVRGGYILKRQDVSIHGVVNGAAFYHLPLSEGLIDRRYAALGIRLLTDALKRQPLLYVLGIGSRQEPLARMLEALTWQLHTVPLFVRVLNGSRTAKELAYLRSSRIRRTALDLAAISGAAFVGAKLLSRRAERLEGGVSWTVQPEFGEPADVIWTACQSRYPVIAVRDRATLDVLYPALNPRFIRVMVEQHGRPIGWATLLATPMQDHKYFGNLRVGTIVDCLAAPEHAQSVITAATHCLQDAAVDLIVSNQSSTAWTRGLARAGFLSAPSTFLFGASKPFAALSGSHVTLGDHHLNRGDGDGPINL
jgi:hypothetical protein